MLFRSLGALDLPGGTLLVVASLYDSRLLGVIELSGDAAVYVSWLADPYFLLSVGGFHPGFQPPAYVPAVLETLRRMRAAIDLGEGISASFESYFAVTSNTVQFGGAVEIVVQLSGGIPGGLHDPRHGQHGQAASFPG